VWVVRVAVRRREDVRVDKPWGYEDRWAITDRYLGKILHIDAGQALSLQYHNAKDECILVAKGEMDLQLDDDSGTLITHRLREGDTVHITPGRKHRMIAVTDVDVFEVSTPEIDDVVRIDDRYGRTGQ
jgi:mannose-6-phosphate isomerase